MLGDKVGRYVNIAAVYQVAGPVSLAHARKVTPLLRDGLVRDFHKNPVSLASDGRSLNMVDLQRRFLRCGKKIIGDKLVISVAVEEARRRIKIPAPAPPPKPKPNGGH